MQDARLRAVLIDIDGTLIDSNDAHVRAWQRVLARHGHEFPHAAIRPLIGKGGDKLLGELLGLAPDAPEVEALSKERGQAFRAEELHRLVPTRGARELLEALHARGLAVVVATAAQAEETQALLRQAGVDDLIDHAASSSDAESSKPDPDIVHAALKRAGVRPSESVLVGDTPWDVEAAGRAAVRTIALRCGGWWNDDAFAGASALYDDPADLLAHLEDALLSARPPRSSA